MNDGELSTVGDRYALRFTRTLPHPVPKVWDAITTPDGLRTWFPFDVIGERRTGAPLRFSFRDGEGEDFHGTMLHFEPRTLMELTWEDNETLRHELTESPTGCTLTLINTFHEIGKAARDAAGWHACLDGLAASLNGTSIDPTNVWQAVHPDYVTRFGPEAATIGPPSA
jgi:uncharacterized protein YndB with AHSA1/START domain